MQKSNTIALTIAKKINRWQKRSPFIILFLACIVGAFTGLLGSLFQLGINAIISWRMNIGNDSDSIFHNMYWKVFLTFIITAAMGAVSYYLVKRYAPESAGSGIPEVEGALLDLRPVRWWRVLPVKFFGGLAALGSGMVLGREGPTVQMGSNLGKMVSDISRVKSKESQHTLIATGAGAGITTAFNAPLGGILFVIEEMRGEFTYTKASIKAVFIGCVSACIVYQLIMGSGAVLNISTPSSAPLHSIWIYIFLGLLLGIIGSFSNFIILTIRNGLDLFYQKKQYLFPMTGAILAGSFGILTLFLPDITGGGFDMIPHVIDGLYAFYPLLLIFLLRFIATVLCFGSGAPGGIFSPTITLGAILGVLFGLMGQSIFPEYNIQLSTCAVLGMAGLFAASIRAPLTGIIIVIEMTGSYMLILPLILTCVAATFMAQTLGATSLYSEILNNTLDKLGIKREE
ncbi:MULTISPECIES: H(+)/Cl(-) exchange transporter ClcA [unclassified Acinetobacter]|uniref:H(+)/Cl(-) exchange transporter ClcA n=1 Tax=unclassified Acinetobacter TaxID=196816 RepID=UPI0029343790|nr:MULTISPECIES: H(+)/Cl(-) exchange transporter ClcA [unclassified Acinetobacter]WOE31212.1 H(+)/Cl(-) exchange transporter ClcA [Acinetobacter sp. SAAs470]WOE39408.1 H(+)/Cl(-) exchange transporter ClcA [Acinetobacter sp. SAAs474]